MSIWDQLHKRYKADPSLYRYSQCCNAPLVLPPSPGFWVSRSDQMRMRICQECGSMYYVPMTAEELETTAGLKDPLK